MKFPNFFKAFMAGCRVVRAKFSRQAVLLDQKSVDRRLAACAACPFYAAEDEQCTVCSCYVPIMAQLSTERCPKGRWSVFSPR